MSWQRHVIKKQVIELQLSGDINSRQINDRVSQVFRDQLLPLIDRILSTNSTAGSVEKIDRLELDLGAMPLSDWETLFVQNTATELERTIRPAIKKKEPLAPIKKRATENNNAPALDMIAYFLQTGLLPWWAKENNHHTFEQALNEALLHEPFRLRKLLRTLLQDEAGLKRLIYSCGNDMVYRIVSCLTSFKDDELKKVFTEAARDSLPTKQIRQIWWHAVFVISINKDALSARKLADKATSLMASWKADSIKQPATLHDAAASDRQSLHHVAEANMEKLIEEVSNYNIHQPGGVRTLERCIQQLKTWQSRHETNGDQNHFLTLDQQLNDIKALLTAHSSTDAEPALHTVITSRKEELIHLIRHHANTIRQKSGVFPSSAAHNVKPAPVKKMYNPFSDTEKLSVSNAGLVLLWPFLHRFFTNLALTSDKAFVNENAAEKACLLLQHITGVSPGDLFEAQLPLNKILCGIDIAQPVNTDWNIEPEEAEAAENFLMAVIQNGQLWKTLSVPGFRQAYLNREALISTRDGNWLLQVKRETYDIIIDRLPWTVQVVKLPWMKHLIFVEW